MASVEDLCRVRNSIRKLSTLNLHFGIKLRKDQGRFCSALYLQRGPLHTCNAARCIAPSKADTIFQFVKGQHITTSTLDVLVNFDYSSYMFVCTKSLKSAERKYRVHKYHLPIVTKIKDKKLYYTYSMRGRIHQSTLWLAAQSCLLAFCSLPGLVEEPFDFRHKHFRNRGLPINTNYLLLFRVFIIAQFEVR